MKKAILTMAERSEQKARDAFKVGLEEGREEGALVGQRKVLLRLLVKKFPDHGEPDIALRLEDIKDLERLSVLAERVLDELSWDEFWAE